MRKTFSTPNPARHAKACRAQGERGMALIEALVASAVLGIGLAGATRLTMHALQTASDTRQNAVAHALAVDAMECHQSGRADCPLTTRVTVQGTAYTLQSQLQPRPDLALVDLQVRAQWPALGRIPAGVNGAEGASGQRMGELVLYTSRDEVPAWVGVSSP